MQTKLVGVVCLASAALAGCGDRDPGEQDQSVGSLRAGVAVSVNQHDVTAFQLDVVEAEQGCDGEALLSEIVPIETEALPESLGGGEHPFGDGFFVLAPGEYRVCATPLAGEGPSAVCATAEAEVEVVSGVTSEVVLWSQCDSDGNGGLDAVIALNDKPEIEALELEPSRFISICESATLAVTASDPNDDELSYAWSIVSGPDGANLRADAGSASFSGPAGDYTLEVSVDDGHGGSASLAFPLHVSDAVCEVPAEVQAIFGSRCSPCHTAGSQGGLHLDPASASYANLVGAHSSNAACGDRVRVVPGDSAASYLVAKLKGEAGICGVRMPRNLPALPEEEIATIEAWINALPH